MQVCKKPEHTRNINFSPHSGGHALTLLLDEPVSGLRCTEGTVALANIRIGAKPIPTSNSGALLLTPDQLTNNPAVLI